MCLGEVHDIVIACDWLVYDEFHWFLNISSSSTYNLTYPLTIYLLYIALSLSLPLEQYTLPLIYFLPQPSSTQLNSSYYIDKDSHHQRSDRGLLLSGLSGVADRLRTGQRYGPSGGRRVE